MNKNQYLDHFVIKRKLIVKNLTKFKFVVDYLIQQNTQIDKVNSTTRAEYFSC